MQKCEEKSRAKKKPSSAAACSLSVGRPINRVGVRRSRKEPRSGSSVGTAGLPSGGNEQDPALWGARDDDVGQAPPLQPKQMHGTQRSPTLANVAINSSLRADSTAKERVERSLGATQISQARPRYLGRALLQLGPPLNSDGQASTQHATYNLQRAE